MGYDGQKVLIARSRSRRQRHDPPRLLRYRAAEFSQQLPPSHGDCHTPLPSEVRKGNDTTPRAHVIPAIAACPVRPKSGHSANARVAVFTFGRAGMPVLRRNHNDRLGSFTSNQDQGQALGWML